MKVIRSMHNCKWGAHSPNIPKSSSDRRCMQSFHMFNLLTREEAPLFWSCEHWKFTKRFKKYGQTNRSHKLQYVIPLRDGFTTSTYFQFHHQFAFLWGKLQTEREKSVDLFGFTPPLQTENEDFHYQDLRWPWWFKTPCAPGPNSIGVQLQWETHLFAELTGL